MASHLYSRQTPALHAVVHLMLALSHLQAGEGRRGSARANGRGARGCGRCGVPFCNFPAAQIGLARSGSPPWASRSLIHASRYNRLQWLNRWVTMRTLLLLLVSPRTARMLKGWWQIVTRIIENVES